ncbi:transcription initiation factor IIB [Candidatus Nitrosotenuis chungbukensis]|uniref:transcription initiation factor IIB n=1 Tax=Candidatus Nitrosotenuis chungbukensis TaxID=1353246 RepID=UPI0026713E38|nr:transcription initiation factor IIB [Candidatus Nitrosotenuis chungbukensis]WKT57232.1 transcription initiation factor IIB [Candidatus Nitrosotenuis chungbukensis]
MNIDDSCKRCKGLVLTDVATGERCCQSCGNVIVERIEESRSARSLFVDSQDDRNRTGAPNSLAIHDRGLATIIGKMGKDASGKSLSVSMKNNIRRLRIWDSRSQTREHIDRNLRLAFLELDKLKDKLTLSDTVIEKTAHIYRKAVGKGLVRGRSIQGVLGAAAYAACRDTGTPRTLNDVSDALNIKRKDISKGYRMLVNELDLKMPVVDSINCVSKIASKVGLDEKTRRRALEILTNANNMEITAGKDPMGLAAAALYIACLKYDVKVSQREISIASGVTEVTIRNRYKGLRESLDLTI